VDLSVVILNWNTRKLLEACLRSLLHSQPGLALEVLVVDNASEDDSREMVRRLFPEVRLLCNPVNIGFGAGNNSALPQTAGRYVLFLNSDTVVTEGALVKMVCYADAHPDIGILGPKLLNPDGSLQYSCRSYPNLGTGFFRNTPLGRLMPKNKFTSDYLLQDWDHATPRDVDWVSGAALMIRRTLLEQIGGFDEEFFMYCEDVDLCWRANHAPLPSEIASERDEHPLLADDAVQSKIQNPKSKMETTWRVNYYPASVIYHHIGKSSDQVPARMTYEFHRSQYLFYKKHYVASYSLLLRPLVPTGIALRAAGQIVRYRLNYWRKRLRGQQKPPRAGGKP
jgi:hypothetical protein